MRSCVGAEGALHARLSDRRTARARVRTLAFWGVSPAADSCSSIFLSLVLWVPPPGAALLSCSCFGSGSLGGCGPARVRSETARGRGRGSTARPQLLLREHDATRAVQLLLFRAEEDSMAMRRERGMDRL
jgi:hypothetical protein